MPDFIQFDTSDIVIGGVNLVETVQSNKKLIYNESYAVVGALLKVPSIYACYDLTVIGDVDSEDIEVKGTLFVKGNIKCKRLSCSKAVICDGDITFEELSAENVIANSIIGGTLFCYGNVIVRGTLDIGAKLITDKSVLAGEGIIGSGDFKAQNAVAAEYFEFEGNIVGKVTELETDREFGSIDQMPKDKKSLDESIIELKENISRELMSAGEINEDQLVCIIERLSHLDYCRMYDWERLAKNIIDISYQDKIKNLREYLDVIMAKKILPAEFIGYETVEHVFVKMLAEAERKIELLPYSARTVTGLAFSIAAVDKCGQEIEMQKEEILDRIFQSIGIKYKTVKGYLN